MKNIHRNSHNTSWQKVGSWYNKTVGESGHYYHQHVVMPGVLKLLELKNGDSLLDLACGQGVLARNISEAGSTKQEVSKQIQKIEYWGVDNAKSLIDFAKKQNHNPNYRFIVGDVTNPLPISKTDFSHAAIILALQNIEQPQLALKNAAKHLVKNGKLVIVLNHPAFRIPRQSSWGIDESKKTEYRRIDRYLSPMRIPITANPGKSHSQVTWSFHEPLSAYSKMLHDSGFAIDLIEEWTSDKQSQGKAAKMENRSRGEFPLFMAISAFKR